MATTEMMLLCIEKELEKEDEIKPPTTVRLTSYEIMIQCIEIEKERQVIRWLEFYVNNCK
jgi:hypothetical protein